MSKIAISFRFICDDEGVLASNSYRQPMPNVIAVGETFSGIKFGIGKVTAEIYNGTRLGNIKLFVKIEIWYNDVFKSPIRHEHFFGPHYRTDVNLFLRVEDVVDLNSRSTDTGDNDKSGQRLDREIRRHRDVLRGATVIDTQQPRIS